VAATTQSDLAWRQRPREPGRTDAEARGPTQSPPRAPWLTVDHGGNGGLEDLITLIVELRRVTSGKAFVPCLALPASW
jgi:hypothetical protein